MLLLSIFYCRFGFLCVTSECVRVVFDNPARQSEIATHRESLGAVNF